MLIAPFFILNHVHGPFVLRMEKVALRSSSTHAKILGSSVSILGALVVLLYKGPIIFSPSSSQESPTLHAPMGSTSQTNWVLGGSLLAVEYLLVPTWYIVQVLNTVRKIFFFSLYFLFLKIYIKN